MAVTAERLRAGGRGAPSASERLRRLRPLLGAPLVLAVLWGAWELYRWAGEKTHLTWPFEVNERTLPHTYDVVGQLFEPAQRNGPLLISVLWDATLFTAKEAAAGFALGAVVGFALGVVLANSRLLQRGFLPYIVASQTIPILAIAPMVVVGLGSLTIRGWTPADWMRVAVIAAYLTFFPVTVNTLRGLQSADPRAIELMHSYAASGCARRSWRRGPRRLSIPRATSGSRCAGRPTRPC